MPSSTPSAIPGSIFLSSVTLSGTDPGGREIDVWYANRYLPGLRDALPGATLFRFASPARAIFGSFFELPSGETARAAALRAAASVPTTMPRAVTAIEQFVAEPIALRKRADAGDWSKLLSGTPMVYAVLFSVPASREVEFNRWYEDEHLDLLLGCNHWLACRRFRLATPHPYGRTHLALHYLADLRALESPEREIAIRTPWRDRLVAEGWFKGEYRVYYRLA